MKDRRFVRARRVIAALTVVAAVLLVGTGAAAARAAAPGSTDTASLCARSASPYAATIRDGRAAAKALLKETGAPSLSLALLSNGSVVWRQGFGYADKTAATPPSPTTMYGIGSVSKMLATVATMKLVDRGLISLDEPFAIYVPSFTMLSPDYREITVRMLLDHASGFPGSTFGSASTSQYWPGYLQHVMDTLAQSRLKHTPGLYSVYCNDGFTMVEALVPAVTGKSYAQFVQDEILTPLGMAHTAFPLTDFADGSYAKYYDGDVAQPREPLNVLAAGAVYSTPTDLGRLATMLTNGGVYHGARILSAASIAEMGQDQTLRTFDPAPTTDWRYGLGWDSISQAGLKAVGVKGWVKDGDTTDYGCCFVVAPKAGLSAIVTGVVPVSSYYCEALCERILLHALVDRGRLSHMPAQVPAAAPPARHATAAQLAAMQGYWAGWNTVWRVRVSTKHPQALTFSLLEPGLGWLTQWSGMRLRTDGRFHASGDPASLRTITAAGRRYLVERMLYGYGHYRDDYLFAQKLRPSGPLSTAWQSRVGRYWLAVNEQPDSDTYSYDGGPLLAVGDIPGFGGQVTVTTSNYGTQVVDTGESDLLGLMFLQIPISGSSEEDDAVIEDHSGEDWIRHSSTLYRPVDGVPALAEGPTTVDLGPEGYTEWRSLPAAASLTISAGTAWYLYDGDMNVVDHGSTFPATTTAADGSYLALMGPANSSAVVTVVPESSRRYKAAVPKRFDPKLPKYAAPCGSRRLGNAVHVKGGARGSRPARRPWLRSARSSQAAAYQLDGLPGVYNQVWKKPPRSVPLCCWARAMNCGVVPLPQRWSCAQVRRMAKNAGSPTFWRSACSVMPPRA